MRHILIAAGVSMLALTACGRSDEAELAAAMEDINVIDESGLNDVMMTVADPRRRSPTSTAPPATTPTASTSSAASRNPSSGRGATPRPSPPGGRGLPSPATPDDRVELAGAYIRTNQWDQARATLDSIPPTHETFERYRYEAMAADAARTGPAPTASTRSPWA
jgi:hypothetical protein